MFRAFLMGSLFMRERFLWEGNVCARINFGLCLGLCLDLLNQDCLKDLLICDAFKVLAVSDFVERFQHNVEVDVDNDVSCSNQCKPRHLIFHQKYEKGEDTTNHVEQYHLHQRLDALVIALENSELGI